MKNNKVERAVILAAGLGTRLKPVTDKIPKPLVKVNDKRIIETALDALLSVGIEDIYIVCGYLAEKFQILQSKYPMLKFINNKYYSETNNISSILSAKNLIRNAYILEGDLLIKNPKVITPYQNESNYLAVKVSKTDDWCFKTDEQNYIKKIMVGCDDECFQMVGISYWTEEDGIKLAAHTEKIFNSANGRQIYWDEIALSYFISEYKIRVRECSPKDIIEIDTLKELQALDSSYKEMSEVIL